MSRRYAREMAMKALFQIEVGGNEPDYVLQDVSDRLKHKLNDEELDYFKGIVNLTLDNLEELDKYIDRHAKNWRIERMGKVDLAILRLALAELFYQEDVPYKVAINEAVELSKKYSTSDSPAYINGIMDNISKKRG